MALFHQFAISVNSNYTQTTKLSPNNGAHHVDTSQHPKSRAYKKSVGYTLLELMISVSLVGILLAAAAPSFAAAIERSKLRATSLKLHHSLALARSTAISQNQTVLVCQLNPLKECKGSHQRNKRWQHGWQVFVDLNNNNVYDNNDTLLAIFESEPSIAVVFNQSGRLRFFGDGSARSAGFYVCGTDSQQTSHLKLLHTGRTRTAKNTSTKAQKICANSLKMDH